MNPESKQQLREQVTTEVVGTTHYSYAELCEYAEQNPLDADRKQAVDNIMQAFENFHTGERLQLKANIFHQFKEAMMKQGLSGVPPEGTRFRTPLEELTLVLEHEIPTSEISALQSIESDKS